MNNANYGVNVNCDGEFVGLWFGPGVIDHDENDYWHVSLAALEELVTEARLDWPEA